MSTNKIDYQVCGPRKTVLYLQWCTFMVCQKSLNKVVHVAVVPSPCSVIHSFLSFGWFPTTRCVCVCMCVCVCVYVCVSDIHARYLNIDILMKTCVWGLTPRFSDDIMFFIQAMCFLWLQMGWEL